MRRCPHLATRMQLVALPLGIFLWHAAPAHADSEISLRQALATALERNFDLAREAVNQGIAEASVQVAQGPFDFRLGADISASHGLGPSTNASWDVYIAKLLPTGGDLQLRFDTFYYKEAFICPVGGCGVYTPALTLELFQPLLQGAWPAVALAPIRKAEVQRSASAWRRAARASEILRDIVAAYWEVAHASREIDIRTGALELARKQLDITRAEIGAGRLAPADALAPELAVAEREAELIAAENNRVDRSIALRRLLGDKVSGDVTPFVATDSPDVAPGLRDTAAERATAVRDNPTLKAVRLDGRVREIDVAVTRRGTWPLLNASGSVGVSAVDSSYGGALGNLFDSSAHDDNSAEVTWSGALSFLHYLGNNTAEGQAEIARLEAKRAAINVEDLEVDVSAQVVRQATALRSAVKLIDAAKLANRLAKQNLEAEEAHFAVGRVRNQDVLLRQEELRQAQLRELRATIDYFKIEAVLDTVTGAILPKYGVAPR
jgi:outer membrane protein